MGWVLRARALLDRRFEVVVVALLVLAGVGGFLAYEAYGQEETTVEQREVTVWESGAEFSHRSTVVDNESQTGEVFEPGEVVRNRSFYYLSIMPELSGVFSYRYGANTGELDVTVEQTLVVRSVRGDRDSTTEYWRRTRALGTDRATLSPGERLSVPYELNVTNVTRMAQRIRERLGDPGRTRISVNTTASVAGTAGGEQVNHTFTYALPVTVEGTIYRVAPAGGTETFTRTERTTVVEQPGPLPAYGGPALLVVSLVGLVGLVYARSTGRLGLSETEREWLAYRDDRSDFDDWVTTIRLPEEAESLPIAEADTLADLVDFAIDTDEAVLESPDGDAYHVVHDGYRYTFETPPRPGGTEPTPEPEPGPEADPAVEEPSSGGVEAFDRSTDGDDE